jgi:hypothetical protein
MNCQSSVCERTSLSSRSGLGIWHQGLFLNFHPCLKSFVRSVSTCCGGQLVDENLPFITESLITIKFESIQDLANPGSPGPTVRFQSSYPSLHFADNCCLGLKNSGVLVVSPLNCSLRLVAEECGLLPPLSRRIH